MDAASPTGLPGIGRPSSEAADLIALAGRVARLSVALALGLEVLLLLLAVADGSFPGPMPFILDAFQKVPWAVVVCAAVALGLALAESNRVAAVLTALFVAPLASLFAHACLEAAHALLGTAPLAGPSPYLIAIIRGGEYAVLTLLVAWLLARPWSGPHHHALVGLATGVVFGIIVLVASSWPAAPALPAAAVLPWVVNELLFPAGCALILYQVRA